MKNKIKISIIITIGIIISLGISSCYMMGNVDTGNLSLDFSSIVKGIDSKSLLSRASTPGYTARIYLFADGKIYPLGDKYEYKEENISENRVQVEIKNIPAGPVYTLAVSIGTKGTNYFNVEWWGNSEEFKIVAGSTVSPTVKLQETSFTPALSGKHLKGVIVNSSTICTPTEDTLYYGSTITSFQSKTLTGYSINSISIGKFLDNTNAIVNEPWLNTTKGIVPFRNDNFDETFSSKLPESIIMSGAVEASENSIVAFYERDSGLGGVYIDSTNKTQPSTWEWLDIDLSDYVSGQPIYDYYNTESYAYFASKLGAFRLSSTLIEEYNNSGNTPNFMDEAKFFSVDNNIQIISLSGYTSGSTKYLVMGTENGAYIGTLDESSDSVLTNVTLLSRTKNYKINKLIITQNPNNSSQYYIAMMSESNLFIYDSSNSTVTSYPFYSGLPGELTGFAWWNDNGSLKLLITGTEGIVVSEAVNQ